MSTPSVGFTVFQVPGARTPKRPTGARLGGGPVLPNAPKTPSSNNNNTTTTTNNSTSSSNSNNSTVTTTSSNSTAATTSTAATSTAPSTGALSSGLTLLPPPADRTQRHSTTTFAVFQPPGGLQSILQRSGAPPVSLNAPYSGTSGSGSTGSHSSTGSAGANGLRLATLHALTRDDDDQSRGGMSWMRTGRTIRVRDSGDSFRFPLETEHLPTTCVSAAQFAQLERELQRIADTHVNAAATWLDNPTQCAPYRGQSWKPYVEKKQCVVYRLKEAADASNLQRRALLRAKLDTSLDDLEYAVTCATTDDQRLYMSHCYQDSFLDAAVLQVHERATRDDAFRFLGIKWLAFQSAVDSVFSCRDALVVEFATTMVDATGHKVLVKVQRSISMAECNGSERSFGFARTTGTWVWLFRSTAGGKVDVSVVSEDRFDSSRSTPSWFANRVLSTLHTVAVNHATAADAKFLVRGRMITNRPWVPNNERPACFVCFKSFNLLRSRHHCRVCAEIMCGACTIELGIQACKLPLGMLPETGNGLIVSVEKFCLRCVNRARQDRRSALAAAKSAGTLDLAADEGFESGVPISYASRASELDYSHVSLARGLSLDHAAERELQLQQQQTHSLASSSSSTSSRSGTNGDKSGISFAGWSTKVLSAINREKTAECAKSQPSLVTLTPASSSRNLMDAGACTPRSMRRALDDRRRLNSDASGCTTSISSLSDCDSNSDLMSRRTDRDPICSDTVVLLEEPSEVLHVTPLPTSFTKMEEQIAAQQALLRSMFIEGKKIMEQQQGYSRQVHPAQDQRYGSQRQPPKSLGDKDRLALLPPSSSTSIEYID